MPRLRRRQRRLREGGGLKADRLDPSDPSDRSDPVEAALAAGFDAAGIVDPELLAAEASRTESLTAGGWYAKANLRDLETDWILRPERRSASSILICALSCLGKGPDDGSSVADPHALVAPFARRNHYAAAIDMLRAAAARFCPGLGINPKKLRLFSNSRLPERSFLLASGLAGRGSNALALMPGLGSLFVIAGAVIPASRGRLCAPRATRMADPCGSCRLCMDACPVGAIVEPGLVDPDICLESLASRPGAWEPVVKEKWGFRLYGCQDCQAVCPHNRGIEALSKVEKGGIGPSVSIARLLSLGPEGVRAFFRGTALGMRWIPPEALIRNALVAAGNRRNPVLRGGIERYIDSGSTFIADAARWSMERCGG
jgi:epoxyqueuosine reductase QueG